MENNSGQTFDPNLLVKKNVQAQEGGPLDDIVKDGPAKRHKLINKEIKITKGFVIVSAAFFILVFGLIAYYLSKL